MTGQPSLGISAEVSFGLHLAPADMLIINEHGELRTSYIWNEAERIEKEFFIPNGWRISTSRRKS